VPIEQAEFGRTGHQSSRVIFGGAALAQVTQRVADETLDLLLAHGVNHLDVASSYGEAEVRIRPWLQREPGRFFLATKGDERTAAGAREELHRSLDRMGVDHVDLWQMHALADPIEWDTALSPGGALEAAVEARGQGLIRWIGVTPWAGRPHTRATWYEPLEQQGDIDLAVWWAMSLPGTFLASVGDLDLLPKVLDAASRFTEAPDDATMSALAERTAADPLFV
jgi:aryl-alcohol dehydrogenase-like predicted oxidoreductase